MPKSLPSRFKPSILQKTKNMKNRALMGLGSLFISSGHRKQLSAMALCLSLFLVGSCNESSGVFDFTKKPLDLQKLTKAELVRYGYALQVAVLQKPENLKNLNATEVQLALSSPDYTRQGGRNNMWQYRAATCVMDVYWRDEGQGRNPVSHFEIRQRRSVLDGTQAVTDPVKWQCIQSIIQDRRDNIKSGFSEIYADFSLKAHRS